MRPGVISSSANPVRIQVKFYFICTCFGVNFCSSGACGIRALPARSSVGVSSLCPWCRLHLVLLPPCLPSAHLHVPCFLFHLFVTCASIIIQFLGFFWLRLPEERPLTLGNGSSPKCIKVKGQERISVGIEKQDGQHRKYDRNRYKTSS